MLLQIDVNSEETLYTQLANQIRYGIAKGYLQPDDPLPSVRNLASELGINMHTVSKAYNKLKEEGIIIINRSKGVRISSKVLADRKTGYETILEEKIRQLVSQSICNGIGEKRFLGVVESVFKKMRSEE